MSEMSLRLLRLCMNIDHCPKSKFDRKSYSKIEFHYKKKLRKRSLIEASQEHLRFAKFILRIHKIKLPKRR